MVIDNDLRAACKEMTRKFLEIDAACGDKPQELPDESGFYKTNYVTPNIGLVIPGSGTYPWVPIIKHDFEVIDLLVGELVKRGAIEKINKPLAKTA